MSCFKSFLIILIAFFTQNIVAQDIEVIKKEKNDNYVLPNIPKDMTYEEFKLLSQHVRMKDYFYAAIVPGHIHYKAQQNKKGYWLLGIRTASYATVSYAIIDANNKYGGLNETNIPKKDRDKYQNLILTGTTIAVATYLYDIIHGEYILHDKQERIRYKNAIRLKPTTIHVSQKNYPALALTLNF